MERCFDLHTVFRGRIIHRTVDPVDSIGFHESKPQNARGVEEKSSPSSDDHRHSPWPGEAFPIPQRQPRIWLIEIRIVKGPDWRREIRKPIRWRFCPVRSIAAGPERHSPVRVDGNARKSTGRSGQMTASNVSLRFPQYTTLSDKKWKMKKDFPITALVEPFSLELTFTPWNFKPALHFCSSNSILPPPIFKIQFLHPSMVLCFHFSHFPILQKTSTHFRNAMFQSWLWKLYLICLFFSIWPILFF